MISDGSQSLDDGWRRCYSFIPETRWNPLSGNKNFPLNKGIGPTNVAIVSYNLMSEPNAPRFETRFAGIVEEISKSILSAPPSLRVLCLQEVDDEMLPLLLGDPTLQELFPFSTHSPSSVLPSQRNLVTLSTAPFSCYTFQFLERHKSALIISFQGQPVQVANVHLTSGLTNESVAVKKSQMQALTTFFSDSQAFNSKNILFAGDFNLTSSSKTIETALSRKIITSETAQLVREVIDTEIWDDAFVVLGSTEKELNGENLYEGEEGATFDRQTNSLASMSKVVIDNRPQRYDRVLFKRCKQIHPLSFEIFGRSTGDGTCLSDHYGICATMQIDYMDDTGDASKLADPQKSKDGIMIVEDSTDLGPLIESRLPLEADRKQREETLNLLRQTLSQSKNLSISF
jgi:endonuclease/exonuclease/phosphatase family metal-dependent hydrolase